MSTVLTVLIVDDDSQVRFLLKTILEDAGYEVDEAETGIEALKRYDPDRHDIVILDIIMPDMEGVETLRRLRTRDPSVRVIAVSGGGRLEGEHYLKMMRGFGLQYTFPKPVDPDKLLEAVRDLSGENR
jgi:DNA-binding response OmpR family regulator